MDHFPVARAELPAQSLTGGARGLIRWVCTNNPFYVLSALLVCLGLWTSFGAQVRPEQTWALMFGLAGYTLLLAVPACLLVRFGGVWQDVRTVLLLVVLMFLATSVTFDETLARNPERGVASYLVGMLFAVAVSEGILRGIRLRLPSGFRVPYSLALALFFLYPAALVPLLDRPRSEALQWALFGFSPAAGLVALTLLPAIRRGPGYVRLNGSPWPWPLYPWVLFGLLGFAVPARSFLLCWSMQHVERTDPERLIFGPYFLVPFLLAVAVLLLELGLVARRQGVVRTALAFPVGLVFLAMAGNRPDELFRGFRALFIARLGGTPLYLTLLAASGFYLYAALRRVPLALDATTAALATLVVVGPETLDLHRFHPPAAWPLLATAALQLGLGLHRHNAVRCLFASGSLIAAAMLWPDWYGGLQVRAPLAFHLAVLAVLIVGATFDDRLGRMLRASGVAAVLLACVLVSTGRIERAGSIPSWIFTTYPLMMAAVLATYALLLGDRPALAAAAIAMSVWLAALGWHGYRSLRNVVVGLDYIAAGLILLVLAHLISLGKAGLLFRLRVRGRDQVGHSSG